jgi:hypothetical protein
MAGYRHLRRVGFRSLVAGAPCAAHLRLGIEAYVTAYFPVPCGTMRFKSQSAGFRWDRPQSDS